MTVKGPQEKPVSTQVRYITAASVALMRPLDDSILVVRRSGHMKRAPHKYEFPGGKVEGRIEGNLENTVETQIVREVREEVNVIIDPTQLWYKESPIIQENDRVITALRYLSFFPSGQRLDIRNVKKENEHDGYKFVRAEDYESYDYISGVREFLKKLFDLQKSKGTLLYNIDKMADYNVNYIFVDPKQEKVLILEDTSVDSRFRLPTTSVSQWEHLHDGIRRGVLAHINRNYFKPETECWGRRVLVKSTPVIRDPMRGKEISWDFIYFLYIPGLCESTGKVFIDAHNYQWVGFNDREIKRACLMLQARGLEERDTDRISKQLKSLAERGNPVRYKERMYPILSTNGIEPPNLK